MSKPWKICLRPDGSPGLWWDRDMLEGPLDPGGWRRHDDAEDYLLASLKCGDCATDVWECPYKERHYKSFVRPKHSSPACMAIRVKEDAR